MNEERKRILNMLAANKITAQEAEALLDAVGPPAAASADASAARSPEPRYLRVLVEGDDGGQAGRVNVRVPLQLIRAGMRLAALLPAAVHAPVNKALQQQGIDLDISKLKAEDLEALVEHLRDLTLDVDGGQGEKIRVFCE